MVCLQENPDSHDAAAASSSTLELEVLPSPSPKKQRRDDDLKYERICHSKLSFVDKEILTTIVAADGHTTPKMMLQKEMREKAKEDGRLSTHFWEKIFSTFDLGSELVKLLPAPPDKEPICEELAECIKIVTENNPVDRRPGPLCDFLAQCGPLNEKSFHALLSAMQVGAKMSLAHAKRIQPAVAMWMAEHNMHFLYPLHWKVIRNQMDTALRDAFEDSVETAVRIKFFLRKRRKALCMCRTVFQK